MHKNLYLNRFVSLANCFLFIVSIGISIALASQPVSAAVIGDLNNDGSVTSADLSLLLANYGKSGTGDLNSDGKVTILDLSIMLSKLRASSATGTFTVSGTKILGPDGKEFVPMGANFSGPYFVWADNLMASGRLAAIKDGWRFNTIELDTCYESEGACTTITGGPSKYHFNEEPGYLDKVIDAYTKAGIVVMISSRQVRQGTYPQDSTQIGLQKVVDWWTQTATKYKNNPYVWFDILNEPGYPKDRPLTSETLYRDNHKAIISAIRDTAKANNIISVQATQYGQDTYGGGTGPNTTTPSSAEIAAMDARLKKYSGLLTWGDQIRGNYKNIVFNVHVYSGWGVNANGQTDTQRDNYLGRYFDLIHQSNVPILVGEVGTCKYHSPPEVNDGKTGCKDSDTAATGIAEGYAIKSLFRVAPQRKVGILFWHAQGLDGRILMKPTSDTDKSSWTYDKINSFSNPTNLSWQGQLLWNQTRTSTFAPPRN